LSPGKKLQSTDSLLGFLLSIWNNYFAMRNLKKKLNVCRDFGKFMALCGAFTVMSLKFQITPTYIALCAILQVMTLHFA
jgi:hypothetical protein